MIENVDPKKIMIVKKWGYLVFWATLLPLLPITANWGSNGGQNFSAWAIYLVVFGIIPILDFIVGKDPSNPDELTEVPALNEEKIYRIFTLLMAPVGFWALYYSGSVFVSNDYNWVGKLGWIVSIGSIGGIIAINLGHEMTHKDPRLENSTGGLLLASVSYAGFTIEHIRGHHVHVSTPADASATRYNQSLHPFL